VDCGLAVGSPTLEVNAQVDWRQWRLIQSMQAHSTLEVTNGGVGNLGGLVATLEVAGNLGGGAPLEEVATLEVWQRRMKGSRWLEVLHGRNLNGLVQRKEKMIRCQRWTVVCSMEAPSLRLWSGLVVSFIHTQGEKSIAASQGGDCLMACGVEASKDFAARRSVAVLLSGVGP
jgi:hypothetical protein